MDRETRKVQRKAFTRCKSLLNSVTIAELGERIEDIILKQKKYRDRNYSQAALALDLGENIYVVKAVFDTVFHTGYVQYINRCRIIEAKAIMEDKRFQDMSLTEIATTVGFRTLQPFERNFINFVGKSPKDYMLDIKSNQSIAQKRTIDIDITNGEDELVKLQNENFKLKQTVTDLRHKIYSLITELDKCKTTIIEKDVMIEEILKTRKQYSPDEKAVIAEHLRKRVDEIPLTTKTKLSLKRTQCETLGDIIKLGRNGLLAKPYFGHRALEYVENLIVMHGLNWDIDVDYFLNEEPDSEQEIA